MIVVIGQPILGRVDGEATPAGRAARIALAAASRGGIVQLVAKVGEDPAGDELVLALARGGVGHAALLRDPAHPTPVLMSGGVSPGIGPAMDAADVELALRYLTEFQVMVIADDLDAAALQVIVDAASWGPSTLIALTPSGVGEPAELPPDAIVLGAPADDGEGAFDRLVGELAAAIDAGGDPGEAFGDLVARGWEPASQ